MRRFLIVVLLGLLMVGVESCHKNKYCQCYAYVDGEDIALGEDIDISAMTYDEVEALEGKYKYNLYVIESGTCSDKSKEIQWVGQQVTCKEVSTKVDASWLWSLFNKNNNNNNNNTNH